MRSVIVYSNILNQLLIMESEEWMMDAIESLTGLSDEEQWFYIGEID